MPSSPPGDGHGGATPAPGGKKYTLLGADRRPYPGQTPGEFGGHRKNKIYGRLDCPAALRAIAAGGYVASRVFFADEPTAVAAGYRPCATCMPAAHNAWKGRQDSRTARAPGQHLVEPAGAAGAPVVHGEIIDRAGGV
jgi:Metal binding domain of Ada